MAIISRFLDTTGDGTGTKNAVGDYSSTPGVFKIVPGEDELYKISRMIVSYSDTANWSADFYGDTGAALTNGIQVAVHDGDDSVLYYLTDPDFPVKTNAQWAGFCYDFTLFAFGAGNDRAAVRWTFSKSGSTPKLNGDQGEYLAVTLNDDFSGLVQQFFLVQGFTL